MPFGWLVDRTSKKTTVFFRDVFTEFKACWFTIRRSLARLTEPGDAGSHLLFGSFIFGLVLLSCPSFGHNDFKFNIPLCSKKEDISVTF